MASIIIFDEGASPQAVLAYYRRVDLIHWVDPVTKAPLRSDVLVDADLSSVDGVLPRRHWKVVGTDVVAMSAAEQAAADAAAAAEAEAGIRQLAKDELEGFYAGPLILRAFADIVRDEINILRAQHGLPARTLVQLRNAIQNRIDSGDVDA